jgi:hypothetical protein
MLAIRDPFSSNLLSFIRGVDSKIPKSKVPVGRVTRSAAIASSLLFQKLAGRIGERRAAQVVDAALERSGRTEVPDHLDDLLSFTKAHLMGELVAVLGARDVSGFLTELQDAARLASGVRPTSSPPEVRGIVAVIDRDVFRRANTARQLISRKLQVLAIHSLDDLLTDALRPDVILLEEEDALSPTLFRVLSQAHFDPAVVLRAETPAATRMLVTAGIKIFEATSSNAPLELALAVERVLTRKRA